MNKKAIIFISFCALMILLGVGRYFLLKRTDVSDIRIINIKSHKFTRSYFCFTFESPYNERILKLRKREKLDVVVNRSQNEFEKILRIRRWVRRELEHGEFPFPYPPWDALVILDWLRAGETTVFCGQYAVVFAQALISMNIPVRYLDTANKKGDGHFLTEVWSRDFNKWIVMDPYDGLHFERNNVPLNALELHDALADEKYRNIKIIKDDNIRYSRFEMKEKLDYYHTFGILLRNNHTSEPVVISALEDKKNMRRRILYSAPMLQYRDSVTKNYLVAKHPSSVYKEDLYWKPDIIIIKVKKIDYTKGRIILEFERVLSEGDIYLYKGREREEYQKTGKKFIWELKKGYNKLYVVNKPYDFDVREFIQSYIEVEYNP